MVKQGIYNARIKGSPYFLCCRHLVTISPIILPGTFSMPYLDLLQRKEDCLFLFKDADRQRAFEVADYNLSMELMDVIIHDKKVLDNEED